MIGVDNIGDQSRRPASTTRMLASTWSLAGSVTLVHGAGEGFGFALWLACLTPGNLNRDSGRLGRNVLRASSQLSALSFLSISNVVNTQAHRRRCSCSLSFRSEALHSFVLQYRPLFSGKLSSFAFCLCLPLIPVSPSYRDRYNPQLTLSRPKSAP